MFKKSVHKSIEKCKEIKQRCNCSSYYTAFFEFCFTRYFMLTCMFVLLVGMRTIIEGDLIIGLVLDILDITLFSYIIVIALRDLFVLKGLDKSTLDDIKNSNTYHSNRASRRRNKKYKN